MVPHAPADAGGMPHTASTSAQSASGPSGIPSPRPDNPQLNRLDGLMSALETAGVSAAAATTASAALRPSSEPCMLGSGAPSWCGRGDINPFRSPIAQVLDYLQHLLDSGLEYHTVLSHVSALSKCLPLVNGQTVGNHPWVTQWVAGLKTVHPPRRVVYPPWDLGLVLSALTEAPYEPIGSASLEALALKTAFLIAVLSSRRVSDLHALSRHPRYLTLNPLSAVLRVNPTFVPKTTTDIALLNSDIELQAFFPHPTTPLERLEGLNCPIRALHAYLKATQLMALHVPVYPLWTVENRARCVQKCLNKMAFKGHSRRLFAYG
jgi:hypothetical protein